MLKIELINKIENKEIANSRAIWKFLSEIEIKEISKSFGITKVEKLYNWLYEIEIRKCKHCNSANKLSFINFMNGYGKFCSPKCASDWYRENETTEQKFSKSKNISKALKSKSEEEWKLIQSKQNQTKLERYGSKNYNNHEKQKKTMIARYGTEYPLQIPMFNKKFKQTISTKDWSLSNKLRKQTLLEETGYDHQLKNPKTKSKIKQTNLMKYGVENPSQSPEIAEKKLKSSFLKKEYMLPSGKIELVQGYENFELNRLLEIYDESELVITQTEMPEIWYYQNGKKHRYIPDIYIPKENKIIEVKSPRTMKLHLEKNFLKKARCIEMGFDFEFRIYDGKMNLIDEKEFLN